MPFLARADIGVNLMTSSLTGPKPKRPVRRRLCIPPAVTSTTFSTFSTIVGRFRSNLDESSPNPNCPMSPCPHTNTRPVTRGLSETEARALSHLPRILVLFYFWSNRWNH
uniref:Uncharacterized protein n=1 Tax=Glossina austeni TaxID=7395 RepID=A0A1A9VDW0_GLOAU